jgi:hypothetical protein
LPCQKAFCLARTRHFAFPEAILPCQKAFCLARRDFALLEGILPRQAAICSAWRSGCLKVWRPSGLEAWRSGSLEAWRPVLAYIVCDIISCGAVSFRILPYATVMFQLRTSSAGHYNARSLANENFSSAILLGAALASGILLVSRAFFPRSVSLGKILPRRNAPRRKRPRAFFPRRSVS